MDYVVIILLIGLAFLILRCIFLFSVSISNSFYSESETEYKQAGVIVNYVDKTISIKGKVFGVNQVTGMRYKSFESTHRHGDSKAKIVLIEIDDMKYPVHKILFITPSHADKFLQRLSVALRKAGGPSFT